MQKLKQCPFCGGKGKIVFEYILYEKKNWHAQVYCENCHAESPGEWEESLKEAKQEAIKKWNRRCV